MKYIMVTNWDHHWNYLGNRKTSYSLNMIKWNIANTRPLENSETLFIKRHKITEKVERCWIGRVKNFERDKNGHPRIYFNVEIEREVFCPENYKKYPEGWYCEEELEGVGRNRAQIKKPLKIKSKNVWDSIRNDFGMTKNQFGKKINFVRNGFKRKIIFRDIEQAYILVEMGYYKPAVILAGSIVEELLRLYLKHKNIKPDIDKFDGYIKACRDNRLLRVVQGLTESVRHFRNFVHLENEETKKNTIVKSNASGAVASIFSIVNDL